MLDELERKLVSVVAAEVVDRAHLDVVQTAGPGDEPTAGRTVARFAVESCSPETGFERDVIELSGPTSAPVSRRVLPLRFTATARLAARPSGATAAARTAARGRLLGDASAICHALAAPSYHAGAEFTVAGDPGFAVREFRLAECSLTPDPAPGAEPGLLGATLNWQGRAIIWPVKPPEPEGVTAAIDIELNATPLVLSARDPVVRQGGSTVVTIEGIRGRRGTAVDPPADEPLALAVSVTSDLPPAERGQLTGGTAGTEAGVRIVPLDGPLTTVTYVAPTAALGAVRVEFVAVHYATRELGRGVLIDALPIRLVSS